MKKIITLILAVAAATAVLAAEGGVEFSGEVESLWGIGAPWTDSDTAAGKYTLGDTGFTGTLDAFYDKSSAFAEGSVSYNAISKALDISVSELWLDYTDSFWGIRIGRQKTAWGKADGIDITNVICPKDMSGFSAMVSDDSHLAIDAVRLSLSGEKYTADVFWIPFFTPTPLPLDDGNVLRKYVVPETYSVSVPSLGTLKLPISLGTIEEPEKAIWNSEFGAKVSGYFSACDLSLYSFYGWDDMPVLDYGMTTSSGMPSGINVSGKYKRLTMFGADAAVPIKEFVIRTELAFFPDRYFTSEEKRNQISALAGVDWMPTDWTITAQYFCEAVFGDLDKIKREDAYTHGATLSVSRKFLNETLEASFSGLVNFNDFDSLLNPSVNYSLSDQITLEGGAYIFIPGPDKDGKYGAYKDLSTIYIKAKYSF